MNIYTDTKYTEPMPFGNAEIRPLDLLEHAIIMGSTGTGKTRAFLLPLVEQMLARFGNGKEEKAGMLLVDAKGDMTDLARRCIDRSGRDRADVLILGPGGNCWFPIFEQFDGDSALVADFLFELLEGGPTSFLSHNESFWRENAKRLLRAAAIIAKAKYGLSLGGIVGVSEGINEVVDCRVHTDRDEDTGGESDTCSNLASHLDEAFEACRISLHEMNSTMSYIRRDVIELPNNTWATISNMARNYIEQFASPYIREIFSESGHARKITPDDVLDEGCLMIVNLSPVVYGPAARPFRLAVKKAFFDRLLQRPWIQTDEGGCPRQINQSRPFLVVMDEFHTTMSWGQNNDAYFLDRAREFKCMCLLATQGISAITSVCNNLHLVNHMLNNCRTKVFFSTNCPDTMGYFESIGGEEERLVSSYRSDPKMPRPLFRLPNHEFAKDSRWEKVFVNAEYRKMPRLKGYELRKLERGTAYILGQGDEVKIFTNDPKHYGDIS